MMTLEECQYIQISTQFIRFHALYCCFKKKKNVNDKDYEICPWLTMDTPMCSLLVTEYKEVINTVILYV